MSSTQSTLPVTDKADGIIGNTAPAVAIQVGGTDGSVLRALKTTTVGEPVVSTKKSMTPSAPTSTIIGTTSGLLLAANANRKGLVITNTSGAKVSLAFGFTAVQNTGIFLAGGSVFVMDEYTFTTSAINAVASANNSNIAIQEFT